MTDLVTTVVIIWCALVNLIVLVWLYAALARKGLAAAFLGMVFLATLGTEYSLRPFQILSSGEFGWEPSIVRPLTEVEPDALALASIFSVVGVALFSFSLVWASSRNSGRRTPRSKLAEATVGSGTASMRVPLGLATLLAVIASGGIALQLGRIGGSLEGEFGRQNIGSGYTYLFVNLAGLSALVAMVALRERVLTRWRTRLVLAGSYLAFVLIHLLILGGRAEIIIVSIALLLVMTARLGRPKKPVLLAILVVATFALGLYRVTTRESFGNHLGESKVAMAISALQDPLALITRYDVSAYDKLVLLDEVGPELRYGETYAAALLAPLPGNDLTTLEGGNRQFTRVFIPERYRRGVTYEGISMLGEARFNFGWLGPPIVAILAGFCYGQLVRRARDHRQWLLTLSLAAGIFPSLVRADALNTAALGGSLIVFTLLISAVVARRRKGQQSRPDADRPAAMSRVGARGGEWT